MVERIARKDVPQEQRWNSEAMFANWGEFEAEMKSIEAELPSLSAFQGRFSEGASVIVEWFEATDMFGSKIAQLKMYLNMAMAVDTSDDMAKAKNGQLGGLMAKFNALTAFDEPEMVTMIDTLLEWTESEPNLAVYKRYFEFLKQQAEHTRSAEVEELLGMLGEPFSGTQITWSELANGDLNKVHLADKPYSDAASLNNPVSHPDRDVRKQAWIDTSEAYLAYQSTLASNYITSVRQTTFMAKTRKYDSVLQMRMEPTGLPTAVFHNLIDAFKDNLGTWHRYWDIKRRILGYDEIHPYDTWAPIVKEPPVIPFEQAVDWIADAVQVLGDDYVNALRRGCLEDRWVDRAFNTGKRMGAFSSRTFNGSLPYIMMSYNDSLLAMSTLAHELGHSMNFYLMDEVNQPLVYRGLNAMKSESLTETPSNFHQAMTRAYLRKMKGDDEQFMIAMIDEAMFNFHRYFFFMPSIARFEYEVHRRVMEGEPVSAKILNDIMADVLAEGYGDTMTFNRDYAGVAWSQLGHVFIPFYSFQYAIGISAAHAIAADVLDGKPNAAENFLEFASLGTAKNGLELFAVAGVDMTTREPIDKAFAVLKGLVDTLDELAG